MKRSELEKHLGEKVVITLYDGEIIFGYLRKTGDEMFKDNPGLYLPVNRYFMSDGPESKRCLSFLFCSSHVKKLYR